MNHIFYSAGYKYQLRGDYDHLTEIRPQKDIATKFIALRADGLLTIRDGYAWDGPSGPAVDTANFMRGSIVHDALYQLIRDNLIGYEYRQYADRLLEQICREDGMSKIRAWWVYQAVRFGGGACANTRNQKPVIRAPL
jgi:hypothetical protein